MELAVAAFGRADILINSAAIFEPATLCGNHRRNLGPPFRDQPQSPLLSGQGIRLPICQRREESSKATGQILNILDWRATHPAAGRPPSGLHHRQKRTGRARRKLWPRSLGPANIRVNGIAPGAILPPPSEGEDYLKSLAQNNPLHRVGSPDGHRAGGSICSRPISSPEKFCTSTVASISRLD